MRNDYRKSISKLGKKGSPETGYKLEFVFKDKRELDKEGTHKKRFDYRRDADDYARKLINDYEKSDKTDYVFETEYFRKRYPLSKTAPEPEKAKPITFREYANFYLEKLLENIQPSSRQARRSEVKRLVGYFGDMPLAQIRRKEIEEFWNYIKKEPVRKEVKVRAQELSINPATGRKHFKEEWEVRETERDFSTVNHFMKRLRALNRAAFREEVEGVREIDFSGLIQPKRENVRTVTISFEELEILLEHCYKPNLRLEIVALFELGCRLRELKHIRRKHLGDRGVKSVGSVLNSKKRLDSGVSYRRVYFSKRLREEILKFHNLTESEFEKLDGETFLFETQSLRTAWEGLRKRASKYYTELGDYSKANKIATIQERDFRTSHRTNLLEARLHPKFLDLQTGHNQDSITSRHYEHTSDEAIAEEFEYYEMHSAKKQAQLKVFNRPQASTEERAVVTAR